MLFLGFNVLALISYFFLCAVDIGFALCTQNDYAVFFFKFTAAIGVGVVYAVDAFVVNMCFVCLHRNTSSHVFYFTIETTQQHQH